jgi:GNAT superfamily N-acetyltransferase
VVIEPIVEAEIDSLRELQPDGWSDIVPAFKLYTTSSFCYPIKVKSDNGTIGIGAGIRFGNTGWLAHIIVQSKERNKGIGSKVVDCLLNRLKCEGCESISLIATELGYPIYKKFGFADQTDYVFFERSEPLKGQSISGNVLPCTSAYAEDIFSLDQEISGETRTELLRDKLANSFVYREGREVTGFYLPEVGEGLIVANNAEAGIELMGLRLSRANKSVVPADNETALAFLVARGYREYNRAKRMIWGKTFGWQPRKLFNRIAGNIG